MTIFINIILFVVCLAVLFYLQKKGSSFNVCVIAGLLGGIAFGVLLRNMASGDTLSEILRWVGIIGSAYVRLIKMMVIPLIFVSITCAIINQKSGKGLGKTTAIVLAFLLGTAAIAAVVGIATAKTFNISAEGISIGEKEQAREKYLEERKETMTPLEQTIVNIIPTNPVYALTGQGDNATLSVVLFACFVGLGLVGVRTYAKEQAEFFEKMMNSLNILVVEIVMMILMLTPYGIFSLMAQTVANSDVESIMKLASFVMVSYVAIIIMFIIHGLLLAFLGLNPITYFKKALPTLSFAFTSRTSAGTLPLTTRTLTEKMGVDSGVSNLAASLGTSIGQNGCAAIYPAMLVVMVLPTVGRELTPSLFITTVVVITFASIGIAGVGGGATFAGITVLSALGLPVGIAGLLVAVEPLIDMARTALNVSDGMIAALGTAKITGDIKKDIYNNPKIDFVDKAK